MTKAVGIALLAVGLMAFGPEEARQSLHGEWQARASAVALTVNARDGRATYINSGRRIDGPFQIDEIHAQSVIFRIGEKQFIAHFPTATPEMQLSLLGSRLAITMKRVK